MMMWLLNQHWNKKINLQCVSKITSTTTNYIGMAVTWCLEYVGWHLSLLGCNIVCPTTQQHRTHESSSQTPLWETQILYSDSRLNVLTLILYTRSDQKVTRLIFLLGCGYALGHPCLQGGVLELPLSLGQWLVPACLSVLCELQLKRVVYLRLVIVRAVWDVGRATAARVQQVLCETGKKWCGDKWNVDNCLQWAVFELWSHFRMAQEI
jgi:hypothetical protein